MLSFFSASLEFDMDYMQIQTALLVADKYWSIKFAVNKASQYCQRYFGCFSKVCYGSGFCHCQLVVGVTGEST